MKKRVIAVLCTVLICFNCLVLPVMASVTAAGVLAVIGTIVTLRDFADIVYELYAPIKAELSAEALIAQQQLLAYWNEVIVRGELTEVDFRAYYTEVVNCAGNSAYYDNIPLTEEQLAVVDAYPLVLETSANGISLDDICEFCFNDAGEATDNPDTTVNDDGYVEISGETFAEICERLQRQYMPASQQGAITYCTDTRWKSLGYSNRDACISFMYENKLCGTSETAMYLVPFYIDKSGNTYYGTYQYHVSIYLDTSSVPRIKVVAYDISTGDAIFTVDNPGNYPLSTNKWSDVSISGYSSSSYIQFNVHYFSSYNSYISGSYSSFKTSYNQSYKYPDTFYSVDKLSTYNANTIYNQFKNSDPTSHGVSDYGFLFDTSYIGFKPYKDIDTTMIDPTATVTLTGDTIYEYTITNSEGDSTTINYYINNNYTIPETPDVPDDETGEADDDNGGTVGGDVTVGGKVDVSGDINVGGEVDININVNQDDNGGADVDPYDYEEVNLGEALEQIPEIGDGFKSWFARMFDWLPPEVLGLIIGGLTLAILLRIAGR